MRCLAQQACLLKYFLECSKPGNYPEDIKKTNLFSTFVTHRDNPQLKVRFEVQAGRTKSVFHPGPSHKPSVSTQADRLCPPNFVDFFQSLRQSRGRTRKMMTSKMTSSSQTSRESRRISYDVRRVPWAVPRENIRHFPGFRRLEGLSQFWHRVIE